MEEGKVKEKFLFNYKLDISSRILLWRESQEGREESVLVKKNRLDIQRQRRRRKRDDDEILAEATKASSHTFSSGTLSVEGNY